MGAYKGTKGRKVYIDFTDVVIPESNVIENCRKARLREQALKAIFPYQHILGKRRIIEDPAQLQDLVDEYFESCEKPLINKWGDVQRDDEGHIIYVQTKPYTISGLARALGMSTYALRDYNIKSLAGLVHPEFSSVILAAKQRVQQYAEERLFDQEGSRGAQFSLQAGFAWNTKKEQSEIARNYASIKKMQWDYELQKAQHKLKEQLINEAADSEDCGITINIVRASKKGEDDDE